MTEHTKGLVWIFPHHPINKSLKDVFNNRHPNEDAFLGFYEEVIIIDLDKCVMYVANSDNPKILKLKEINPDE